MPFLFDGPFRPNRPLLSFGVCVSCEQLLEPRASTPAAGPAELSPCIMPLLEALFAAFKHPDSSENEYVMRCVMRVVMVMGPAIAPAAVPCLQVRSSGRPSSDMCQSLCACLPVV